MNLTFLGWSKMEIKSFGQIVLLCSAVMTLAACQSLDTARLKKIQETPSTQANAKLYCSGVEVCEFERLGPTFIVKERNHRINRDAMEQGIVRINLQAINANKVYLSVKPKQHEVVIRFYPVSKDRAEKLYVIHKFKANQKYTFNMYRKRNNVSGSLLNVSAPEPLCVDLKEGQKVIRRFCKPYNVLSGLGEFTEKKL